MPTNRPPKLPRLGFASFGPDALGQGMRRKPRWSINPLREPSAGQASDTARRFVNEDEVLQRLGRKPGRADDASVQR